MFNVLRIKAISSCMGIRRKILEYREIEDGIYEFKNNEYPLSKIKFEFDKAINQIKFQDKIITLNLGNEEHIYIKNEVSTLTGDIVDENIFIGIMILPLDIDAIPYYENAISNGDWFDESKGEFEYLIGLIYEHEGKNDLALEYFKKSYEYGFLPSKLKIDKIN